MRFRQENIAGGHLLIGEAQVADGQVRFEETWQHLHGDGEMIAGSALAVRHTWLNGALVKDPALAERLWAEAMGS